MKYKIVFLCAVVLVSACSKENDPYSEGFLPSEIEKVSAKKTFVSKKEAIHVAEVFFRTHTDKDIITKSETGLFTAPASIKTLEEDTGDPMIYVLNYQGGGYALISATRDYVPVLAYSDKGFFELSADMGPLAIWFEETKVAIRTHKELPDESKDNIRRMWDRFETQNIQSHPASALRSFMYMSDAYSNRSSQLYYQYGHLGWNKIMPLLYAGSYIDMNNYSYLCDLANSYGSPLEYTIVVVKSATDFSYDIGPLLTTHWHQSSPYNSVCNSHNYDAGCGAVAMAQIMNFHKFPQSVSYNNVAIDWNDMPNYATTGSSGGSAPYLIAATGLALNTIYTSVGSAALLSQVDNAFRSFFYSVTDVDHDADGVKYQISQQRPVMMFGSSSSIPVYQSLKGHYWVCDGVKHDRFSDSYFVEFINPSNYSYSTKGHTSLTEPLVTTTSYGPFFHMNWGWRGSNEGDDLGISGWDGWFYHNGVNTSNGNFKYIRKNFYVHP